jgi:hypothetical protein
MSKILRKYPSNILGEPEIKEIPNSHIEHCAT